jgi:hypothetical protein
MQHGHEYGQVACTCPCYMSMSYCMEWTCSIDMGVEQRPEHATCIRHVQVHTCTTTCICTCSCSCPCPKCYGHRTGLQVFFLNFCFTPFIVIFLLFALYHICFVIVAPYRICFASICFLSYSFCMPNFLILL